MVAKVRAGAAGIFRSPRNAGRDSRSALTIESGNPHATSVASSRVKRHRQLAATVATLHSRRRGRLALRTVVIALIVGSLAIAASALWSKLPDVHWRFVPGWFAMALIAFLSFQAFQAEIWRWILDALGHSLGPWRSRAIWNTSLLGRYVPTNALMAVTRIGMSARAGVPKRVCLASLVYELALVFTGALAIGAYFFLQLPALAGAGGRFAVLALPFLALALLHPAVFRPLSTAALRRLGRSPLRVCMPFSRVLLFTALYALSFLIAGVGVYCFAQALHPVGPGGMAIAIGSFSVGFVASLLAFLLPGGLGAREAGLAAALAPVLPATLAVAVAVGVRLLQMTIELSYASITPLIARRGEPRELQLSTADGGRVEAAQRGALTFR
jgi:glycosyltransferase 2 family protein